MAMKKQEHKNVTEVDYNTILGPHVTEKSTRGSEHGQVTFCVPLSADKAQIKRAVEALWGVKVKRVNTLVEKGKTKRFRGVLGQRSDRKKAVVTLEDGQMIDVGTGI